jgi:hypothetical protein
VVREAWEVSDTAARLGVHPGWPGGVLPKKSLGARSLWRSARSRRPVFWELSYEATDAVAAMEKDMMLNPLFSGNPP